MQCCKILGDTSLVVHILVVLFAIGSWVDINGVWVELPILVEHLPEGWNLGSYLIIIIQVANIGPLLYTVGHLMAPRIVSERPVVFIVLSVGAVACLLLAFLWKRTTHIGGVEHSTAFLILNFFLALVDCTTSIVFLTYISFFKPPYMTSYFIGVGLSALLPSLVAIGQGAGVMSCRNVSFSTATMRNDGTWLNATAFSLLPEYLPSRFPPRDYFLFLFAMLAVSLVSFILLNFLPYCKREQVTSNNQSSKNGTEDTFTLSGSKGVFHLGTSPTADETKAIPNTSQKEKSRDTQSKACTLTNISRCEFGFLLVMTGWLHGLWYGALLSVQPYACLPYGTETYHLSVTLAQIANPLACFLAFFVAVKSMYTIAFLGLLSTLVAAYIFALASLSPEVILLGQPSGEAMAIISQVLAGGLISYARVSMATVCRGEGRRAMMWFGVVTQIGSLVDGVVMFLLINVFRVFRSAPPCPVDV